MLNWIVWNRTNYSYKIVLALNNLQKLICHKTQASKQPTNLANHYTARSVSQEKRMRMCNMTIFKLSKKILTLLWENLYDIISVSTCSLFQSTYLWNFPQVIKNVYVPMGVSLKEKQNWYCENHLGKIPIMSWQGWWTSGDVAIKIS